MWYQLKSGRVIQISLEQYLELTDEELEDSLQYLVAMNQGDYIHNPWHGSVTRIKKKQKKEEEIHDASIDYSEDEEEMRSPRPSLPEESTHDSRDISTNTPQDID